MNTSVCCMPTIGVCLSFKSTRGGIIIKVDERCSYIQGRNHIQTDLDLVFNPSPNEQHALDRVEMMTHTLWKEQRAWLGDKVLSRS